ncbi:MAG TPA: hypothetical protein VFT64_03170 [Rickettsiales bacterium]|nr:hypothetical protein [Rickettsiales bacterium]
MKALWNALWRIRVLWYYNAEGGVFLLLGMAISHLFGILHPENSWFLRDLVVWLLVAGIYLAATGVPLDKLREHWRLIVIAIATEVAVKWVIISVATIFFTGPIALWVCIGLVQIDPITTKVVKRILSLTPAGETLITTVSIYDDMITSVSSVSLVLLLAAFGVMHPVLPGEMGLAEGWSAILAPLAFALLVVVYLVMLKWRAYRRHVKAEVSEEALNFFRWLTGALFAATFTGGAASTGMLIRPKWLERPLAEGSETTNAEGINRVIFWTVFFILGITIPSVKMAWRIGGIAGTASYFSQFPAAWLAFWANAKFREAAVLPREDRHVFSRAQLLGLTAVSLGLNGQYTHVWAPTHVLGEATSGPLSLLLPAILACNLWHLFVNTGHLWGRRD